MMSEIFPVVASDQYTEKDLSPNTLHLNPSPSIISKRQLTGLIQSPGEIKKREMSCVV